MHTHRPVLCVSAHRGVEGNEVADGMAKEAAEKRTHSVTVPDEFRWQTSLPHLSRWIRPMPQGTSQGPKVDSS